MKILFIRFPKRSMTNMRTYCRIEQEMSIIEDMDLVYDLKMADKENESIRRPVLRKAAVAV